MSTSRWPPPEVAALPTARRSKGSSEYEVGNHFTAPSTDKTPRQSGNCLPESP
ncbi:hypothetical protein I545_3994 [Mycobacterium kansasii 662]|uniref:Uncharacterized protein n=2 Tax=Mycobacterium kansasii TaxID=1768 RepID=A0A1V3WJA8_MYCKA|nr:hypothetical protein I545_3994 [Mycobacterium kansasii 662]OOK66516.1 hypothetical protein BZL30_8050 [Mycobacterium kansasii]